MIELREKMKKTALVAISCLVGAYSSAQATQFTEEHAVQVVKNFAETAVCADFYESPDLPVVKVEEGAGPELGQFGERYAVAWYGNPECSGNFHIWNLSFVGVGQGRSSFVEIYNTPQIVLHFQSVDSLDINEDGNIVVKGERYDFREGSGKWDFINKTAVITPSGELLESLVHIDGETHIESDVTNR